MSIPSRRPVGIKSVRFVVSTLHHKEQEESALAEGTSMRNMVGLILGGGKGTRLLPLTQHRSKPAVPLAGKYRLIDIPDLQLPQ